MRGASAGDGGFGRADALSATTGREEKRDRRPRGDRAMATHEGNERARPAAAAAHLREVLVELLDQPRALEQAVPRAHARATAAATAVARLLGFHRALPPLDVLNEVAVAAQQCLG